MLYLGYNIVRLQIKIRNNVEAYLLSSGLRGSVGEEDVRMKLSPPSDGHYRDLTPEVNQTYRHTRLQAASVNIGVHLCV